MHQILQKTLPYISGCSFSRYKGNLKSIDYTEKFQNRSRLYNRDTKKEIPK